MKLVRILQIWLEWCVFLIHPDTRLPRLIYDSSIWEAEFCTLDGLIGFQTKPRVNSPRQECR
jgi:hypothetical protein